MSPMESLEAGLKRLKLRRFREILESDTERAGSCVSKDPVSLVTYLVNQEVMAETRHRGNSACARPGFLPQDPG